MTEKIPCFQNDFLRPLDWKHSGQRLSLQLSGFTRPGSLLFLGVKEQQGGEKEGGDGGGGASITGIPLKRRAVFFFYGPGSGHLNLNTC